MNKAHAIRAKAFDEHVVDKIVPTHLQFVVFVPVSANTDHLEAVFDHGDDVGQADFGDFAVIVLVFKAWNVQIHLHFKQKDFFDVVCRLDTRDFVNSSLNLSWIGVLVLRIRVHIQVFAGHNTLSELVGVHGNAVRDPWALGNDA